MELAGRTLLGKYRIETRLGRGGMGEVWKGVHTATGRPIAVKLLDERFTEMPSVVERFGREARAASAIRHEGIVEVLDLDKTEDGRPFLVMEFLAGESLAQRLEKKGRFTERELAALADPLLDALEAAHERGVVHRDLKPDNIYLTPVRKGDRVKILDFGISSKADEKDNKLTATGSLLGTPHYVSPEQANADPVIDARSDVYSCGVLFYELVVGEVPFDAPGLPRLLLSITEDPPVPPRVRGALISDAMEAVLLRALGKRREDRPQTAAQFRDLVLAAADGTLRPDEVSLDAPTLRSTLAGRRREGSTHAGAAETMPTQPAGPPPTKDGAAPVATAPARKRPQVDGDASASPNAGAAPSALEASENPDETDAPFRPGTLIGAKAASPRPARPEASRAASAAVSVSGIGGGLDDLGPEKRIEVDQGALAVAKRMSEPTGRRATARTQAPSAHESEGKSGWLGVALTATFFGGLAIAGVLIGTNDELRRTITGSSPVDLAFAAPPPVPDAGPDWVTVELTELPADAVVTMNGLPVTGGSVRVRFGTTVTIVVRAPGHEDRTVEVVGDANHAVSAALVPVEAPPPERPRGGRRGPR